MQMRCPESVVKDLKKAGFSILNIANNHCMQHGTEGFQKTRNILEKCGIKPIGIRDENPYMITVSGVELAFLSLCIHLEWYEPEHILYENRIERILREVKDLRQKDPDMIIAVSVHWGDKFAAYSSNAQVALAHKLVDLGANIVLGHHSHVFQGIEEYKGAVVVYGQGNFVSDMVPEICKQTGIVKVEIDEKRNITYDIIPFFINNDYVPAQTDLEWFQERQSALQGVLAGKYTDDDYWNNISVGHAASHNAFKTFFRKNIMKYRMGISLKMIYDFIIRKTRRIIGTTTDGRVSSMDPAIIEAINNYDHIQMPN